MLFSRRVPDVEFVSLDLDTVTLLGRSSRILDGSVLRSGRWIFGFSSDLVLVFSDLDIELN